MCVGVHAILAGTAYQDLLAAGAAFVATSNTIPHASYAIDLTEAIAEGVRSIVQLRES
ncbi:phosphoribosylpyrophosphate synthetase [compost metagenome]